MDLDCDVGRRVLSRVLRVSSCWESVVRVWVWEVLVEIRSVRCCRIRARSAGGVDAVPSGEGGFEVIVD